MSKHDLCECGHWRSSHVDLDPTAAICIACGESGRLAPCTKFVHVVVDLPKRKAK